MTRKTTPNLVSTIIPVYNRPLLLREAVESVLSQTYRPIEIVIVDDGSSDDTPQAAENLRAGQPDIIRVLRQQNAGPGVARQAGFEASCGEFIQFLDSDDLLLPRKFELQVRGLSGDPEAGISYGRTYTRVNGRRRREPAQKSGERHHRELFPSVLTGRLWETCTPLYRRDALERIGKWSDRRQLEDWEYDCRAGAEHIKLQYCEEFVAEYVNHEDERLCRTWMTDIRAMRDRVSAYVAVLGHAKRAGVRRDAPEMQQFVRSLFWMARNAGSRGLAEEAKRLFKLARIEAMNPGWDYKLFRTAASVLGWNLAGRLAVAIDRWRA